MKVTEPCFPVMLLICSTITDVPVREFLKFDHS